MTQKYKRMINIALVFIILLGVLATAYPLLIGHYGLAINGKIMNNDYFLGMGGKYDRVPFHVFIISGVGTMIAPIFSAVFIAFYSLTNAEVERQASKTKIAVVFGLVFLVSAFFFLASLACVLCAIIGKGYFH